MKNDNGENKTCPSGHTSQLTWPHVCLQLHIYTLTDYSCSTYFRTTLIHSFFCFVKRV